MIGLVKEFVWDKFKNFLYLLPDTNTFMRNVNDMKIYPNLVNFQIKLLFNIIFILSDFKK